MRESAFSGAVRTAISRHVKCNGLLLHYLDWGGDIDAPTVVLVHGGRDTSRTWDDVIHYLPSTWRVLAVDLRGHGDSDWAPGSCYSLWDYAGDLDAFIRRIASQGSDELYIAGHSLGGAISLQLAGARPELVQAVVAIEPFGLGRGKASATFIDAHAHDAVKVTPSDSPLGSAARVRAFLQGIERVERHLPGGYASMDDAKEHYARNNPRLSPETVHRLVTFGLREDANGRLCWKFDNRVRMYSPYSFTLGEAKEIWGSITCPVLVINGGERAAQRPASEGYAEFFRNIRVLPIAEAAHAVHLEQPESVANALIGFFGNSAR